MRSSYFKMVRLSIVLVYLVILAGAVVRMTGSGMGCPDWPKCFGYYIPPTDSEQLRWQPEKNYKKGQVIIRDQSLRVANKDFRTGTEYQPDEWSPYTRHDYAIFNAAHTWTEFINRLLGALAGLATLVMAILSFSFRKKRVAITIISWIVVLTMGFQAWLGATVVFSVLETAKITFHMIMALFIVGLLIYLLLASSETKGRTSTGFRTLQLLAGALLLTLIQIVLGTQVRQFVDGQIDVYGDNARHLWLSQPQWTYYIHRSFSVVILLWNIYLAYHLAKRQLQLPAFKWVLGLLLLEIAVGITMQYRQFPFGTQAIHLFLAALIFGLQTYLLIAGWYGRKILKTL